MKGIVWGLTHEAAQDKLHSILVDYSQLYDIYVIDFKQEVRGIVVRLSNGDIWRAIDAHAMRRGYRCNISYIDARINSELVDTVIKPCTMAPPYHAINYFYDFTEKE